MSEETEAEKLLRKRRQIAVAWLFLLGILGLIRTALERPLPIVGTWWMDVVVSLVACALTAWAWRCPICGGGIKLDGKTCRRCGHIFESTDRSQLD